MSSMHWSGAALLAAVAFGAALGAPPPAARKDAVKDDPEVKKKLVQRRDVLRLLVKARLVLLNAGKETAQSTVDTLRKRMEVELEVAETRAERIAAMEDLLRLAAKVDEVVTDRYENGRTAITDLLEGRDFRLQCEIELRRAGGTRPKDVSAAAEFKLGDGFGPKK